MIPQLVTPHQGQKPSGNRQRHDSGKDYSSASYTGLLEKFQGVNFLRRQVLLHEKAVAVGGRTHVGTLKSGRSRSVALPASVVDELAATCEGKDRGELIWPAQDGGYLAPADEQIMDGRCRGTVPEGRQDVSARDGS